MGIRKQTEVFIFLKNRIHFHMQSFLMELKAKKIEKWGNYAEQYFLMNLNEFQ